MNYSDSDPEELSLHDLSTLSLSLLPRNKKYYIFESYFPESLLWRKSKREIVAEVCEHIYTKYWEHKYHAAVFAEALIRAVKRLSVEGYNFINPSIENNDDPHIFIRWQIVFPVNISGPDLIAQIKDHFETVWQRTNLILDNSDSVLLLGKDTGSSLKLLHRIKSILENEYGYYVYLIKEQADKLGESIIQKVLRYALISKFVFVENTSPSGHLYEIPHVTKMGECVTAILQERGKGATWMFEDSYSKNSHWSKFTYKPMELGKSINSAVKWAEKTVSDFALSQEKVLYWLKAKK